MACRKFSFGCSSKFIVSSSITKFFIVAAILSTCPIPSIGAAVAQSGDIADNSIENHKHIVCGTIASNHTHLLIKNPHYPEPTYIKAICETVIERSSETSVDRLNIKFKQLELYRPSYDGTCLHDRFAVYTDLNVAVSPILCGNQTGQSISIPFLPPLTNLIISITTSDLDHDRAWLLEIEQTNRTGGY